MSRNCCTNLFDKAEELPRRSIGGFRNVRGDAMLGLLYALAGLAAFMTLLLLVERLVCWGVRLSGPLLPDDICGPEGWLIDTDRQCGVFDRVARG